ncbi:2'-5' RNA ligase family protein [soil metagenome]
MEVAAPIAPIIVTATMGAADFAWADALRRAHFPAERNQLPAHLTLFHHLPPSAEPELLGRLATLCAGAAPTARIAGLLDLGGGVAWRIESPDLLAMRQELADAFHGMLTPQDRASPRLHVTVQNKVAPAQARALRDHLQADFTPRAFAIAGLAAWRYLGGPWAPIRDYRFRG